MECCKKFSFLYLLVFIEISVCPILCFSYDSGESNEPFVPLTFNELTDNQELFHFNLNSIFNQYNEQLKRYHHLGALMAWNISVNISTENMNAHSKLSLERNGWNNHWCNELLSLYHSTSFQHSWDLGLERQLYLICRGPRFSSYQLSHILSVLGKLQQLYNKKICVKSSGNCMRMEPDLNHFMEKTRDEVELRETWLAWHDHAGGEMKPLYSSLVRMLNQGARQAGFKDMGVCWRADMEIDNITDLVMKLYSDVKYLYTLLHSYVRHKLEEFYKMKFHNGLIPSHLLGNMWAQKWDSLMDILWDDRDGKSRGISNPLLKQVVGNAGTENVTVMGMVKAAEQFFVSMGFPRLPKAFWENSYFEESAYDGKKAESKNCHGSAANMFGEGDYRLMMCAQVTDEDFIMIHHEMGHIMYFMAYSNQPTIFQDGANSAFHESVGDAITYDLLNSPALSTGDDNEIKLLFKTALAKLPQIGFGMVMDLWRWKVFETQDATKTWNKLWWDLNSKFLGISRPSNGESRDVHEGLDAAGKFHVIDNIPYIRYFLASFLQMQFYNGMCNASSPLWNGDMHSCQIRNSTRSGKLLWDMMSKGSSRHWSQVLYEMMGDKEIKSAPLLEYYKPLQQWLEMEIKKLNLTVGW